VRLVYFKGEDGVTNFGDELGLESLEAFLELLDARLSEPFALRLGSSPATQPAPAAAAPRR
jgi:hypothetical protein